MIEGVNIAIAGKRGTGKSLYLYQLLADEERLLLVDTLGEHADWTQPLAGEVGEAIDAIANAESFRYSFLLSTDEETGAEDFNFLCRAAYLKGGPTTLAIEEIDYFSNAGWQQPGLDLLCRYGRKPPHNVNLIYTVRNLNETCRRLTSQTNLYVLFRLDEPRYRDALADRLTDDIAQQISELPPLHYIISQPDGQIQPGVLDLPAILAHRAGRKSHIGVQH